jgi:hypothetical protein
MERIASSAKVSPAIAVGAWLLPWAAGTPADLVGTFTTGFAVDLVAGADFFGADSVVFLAGLAPDPAFEFGFAVSRETSGIRAPKPRPKLCRFAIKLTLLLAFGDFSRSS